ncbi:MAG TPA: CHASE2 domain-containing protein [bacterium]|nr:CHASE2 domain-containing protein [bacterium]
MISQKKYNIFKILIFIGLPIYIIFLLIYFSGAMTKVQNIFYDLQMRKRKNVQISDKIITIDINDQAIEAFGRWPWNWNIHSYLVDFCNLFDIQMLGFIDINFDKENKLSFENSDDINLIKNILNENLKNINVLNEIINSLPDYNQYFYNSLNKYKNTFFCNTFNFSEEEKIDIKEAEKLTQEQLKKKDKNELEKIKLFEKYAVKTETIQSFKIATDCIVPVKEIIEKAAGIGFNRIILDSDGILRKYLLVINYNNKVYPSVALIMAAKYFGCPYDKIKIEPGKYIEFTEYNKEKFKNIKNNIRIPIDKNGFMKINWIGTYDNSFPHYPFGFFALHYSYFLCKNVLHNLSFQNTQPDVLQQELLKILKESNILTQEQIEILLTSFTIAFYFEGFIRNNTSYAEALQALGLPDNENLKNIWDQLYFNNYAVELLNRQPDLSYNSLIEQLKITNSEDYKYFFEMMKFLYKKNKIEEQRPLYFPEESKISIKDKTINSSLLDLRGKIIFYGLTATGLNSFNPTPYEDRYMMLGLAPNVFNTIINQSFIKNISIFYELLILFVYVFFTIFIIIYLKTIISNILFFLILFLHIYISWFLFQKHNLILDIPILILALLTSYFTTILYKFFQEQKERKKVRNMFSTMVSPEVLKMMEANPEKFQLAGEKKEATLFSSDVSGFTTISEGVTAQELAEILNVYLTPMSNIIMSYNGYCDKYEGDAIKADFGVPLPDEDHSWKGCYAALLQQQELKVIQRMILIKYGVKISARMGVNTGIVSAGNMGSEKRMQYTVMGEAVALAEELEPINKLFESWIAIGPTTYEKAKDKIEARLLNYIIMGNEEIMPVYELQGWKKEAFLSYWQDKPIPQLILDNYRKMTPEKILGYLHYFETRKFPDSEMYSYMKNFFYSMKDICIEYIKTNDIKIIANIKETVKNLEETIEKYNNFINENNYDKSLTNEYNELYSRYDKSKGWEKIIYLLKSKTKNLLRKLFSISDKIELSIFNKLYSDIDAVDKRIECINKRIRFPEKDDLIGLELANNLINLVVDDKTINQIEIEKKLNSLNNNIQMKIKEFCEYIKNNANSYHQFLVNYCCVDDNIIKVREIYNQARELYRNRKFDEAIKLFNEALKIIPEDGPSKKFIKKIEEFKKNPPPENWKGEWSGEV